MSPGSKLPHAKIEHNWESRFKTHNGVNACSGDNFEQLIYSRWSLCDDEAGDY